MISLRQEEMRRSRLLKKKAKMSLEEMKEIATMMGLETKEVVQPEAEEGEAEETEE